MADSEIINWETVNAIHRSAAEYDRRNLCGENSCNISSGAIKLKYCTTLLLVVGTVMDVVTC